MNSIDFKRIINPKLLLSNQAISVNMWLRLKWYDPRLAWDIEKYNGVDHLKINPANVWKPDLRNQR